MSKNEQTTGNTSNEGSKELNNFDKIIGLGSTFYSSKPTEKNELIKAVALTIVGVGASMLIDHFLGSSNSSGE